MVVFRCVWAHLAKGGGDRFSLMVEQEFMEALTLLPLMMCDYRLIISPLVTASYASPSE